jgi:hypothetical protein
MTAMLGHTLFDLTLCDKIHKSWAAQNQIIEGEKPVSCKNRLVFCFEEIRGKAVTPFISDMFHYNLEQDKKTGRCI